MYFFARDSLRASVEAATGGLCTVRYDGLGNPHVMRIIPKFTYNDLSLIGAPLGAGTCSAFVVAGREVPEIFVGVYAAAALGGAAPNTVQPLATLPGLTPHRASFAIGKQSAMALGKGWHMLTVHEWAAVVLWMLGNDTMPPTWDAVTEPFAPSTAVRPVPAAWRHDRSPAGIAEIGGFVDLIKMVNGRVVTTSDNAFGRLEPDWTAQAVYFDSPATAGVFDYTNEGDPILSDARSTPAWAPDTDDDDGPYNGKNTAWLTEPLGVSYVPNELMRRLLIEPHAEIPIDLSIQVANYGERFLARGGGLLSCLAGIDWTASRNGSESGYRPMQLAFIG